MQRATRLYLAHSEDKRVTNIDRIDAALTVMDIEERSWDTTFAKKGAKIARSLAGKNDDETLAFVLAFEARQAAKNDKRKKLAQIERKLSRVSLESRDTREALAQTRMIIAQGYNKKDSQEVFNLGLKDPLKALDKRYADFIQIKNWFDKVCDSGSSSFCAPAMMQLAEKSRKTLEIIEDITMVQTLAETAVKSFEDRKLHIITYLDQVARESEERALDLSESGETTPQWAREVQWASEDSSDLNQTNTTSGNGYVQWLPTASTQQKMQISEVRHGKKEFIPRIECRLFCQCLHNNKR